MMEEEYNNKIPPILQPTKEDIALMLAAKCHLGSKNVNCHMKRYIFARRPDGIFIIHLGKLWEKLILAARIIAPVVETSSEDIFVASSSLHSRRPASKFSIYLGTKSSPGRFPPGNFTKSHEEPQLLVCMDPRDDAQAITESSKCNVPVISFANSHSNLKYVDVAIPCNNMGAQSIGVMCYLLTRAVLRLRGALDYDKPWHIIPDMFFYNEELTEGSVDDNEDYPYAPENKRGPRDIDYDTSWADSKGIFGEDDGVNWQSDNPKVFAGGWDDDNQEENMSFGFSGQPPTGSTAYGSTDRTYDYGGYQQPQQEIPESAPPTEPVDWAEDFPEEQGSNAVEQSGWDAPTTTGNIQWQGSNQTPWD